MEATARISSKGQITIPKAVRDALGVAEGDMLVFRVEGRRAIVAATVDLIDLAGSVSVPVEVRGRSWDDIRQRAWTARARDVTQ
jgi:AbrB family looped-hinge helix DNA binding protein